MKAKFSVSIDPDEGIIILFVPNVKEDAHYHIHLTNDAAEDLAAALDRFVAGDNEHDVYDIPVDGVV